MRNGAIILLFGLTIGAVLGIWFGTNSPQGWLKAGPDSWVPAIPDWSFDKLGNLHQSNTAWWLQVGFPLLGLLGFLAAGLKGMFRWVLTLPAILVLTAVAGFFCGAAYDFYQDFQPLGPPADLGAPVEDLQGAFDIVAEPIEDAGEELAEEIEEVMEEEVMEEEVVESDDDYNPVPTKADADKVYPAFVLGLPNRFDVDGVARTITVDPFDAEAVFGNRSRAAFFAYCGWEMEELPKQNFGLINEWLDATEVYRLWEAEKPSPLAERVIDSRVGYIRDLGFIWDQDQASWESMELVSAANEEKARSNMRLLSDRYDDWEKTTR